MSDKSELLQQLKINREQEKPKSGVSLLTVIFMVFISIGVGMGGMYYLFSPQANQELSAQVTETEQPSVASETQTPAPAPPNEIVSNSILNASGYITARRTATVSAEIMGLITEVNVEEGMSVDNGQVLAKLDDVLAKVNYDRALAQLDVHAAQKKSTQVNLQEAQRVYQRIIDNRFSSEAEKTNALTQVQSLEANIERIDADVKVARIELARQKERLNDHTIRAPFAGVVTVKNAQPGEIVAPTSAGGGFTRTGICTIVDMNSLEIEVDVSESFIGRVFAGQVVEAKLDAYPDWIIPASVIAIIPTADRSKATVQVRIGIDITDARILPDMGVKVAFLKT